MLYMGAVVVLAIGMVLIIAGFQFSSIILRPEGKGFFTPIRLFVWLMGLLLVVYALFILVTPGRQKRKQDSFLAQSSGSGELRISTKAVEHIISRCIDSDETVLNDVRIINSRDKLTVDLNIDIASHVHIPQVIDELQKKIRHQLQTNAGIKVDEVRVMVDHTKKELERVSGGAGQQ